MTEVELKKKPTKNHNIYYNFSNINIIFFFQTYSCGVFIRRARALAFGARELLLIFVYTVRIIRAKRTSH